MRELGLDGLWIVAAVGLAACGGGGEAGPDGGSDAVVLEFDFETGPEGWVADFADYPTGEDDFYELEAGIATLPDPLPSDRSGYRLSGNNHSDDLWMFLARRLGPGDGIEPGVTYRVHFAWAFATNAPSNCFGTGGAPGESVYMKVGASAPTASR